MIVPFWGELMFHKIPLELSFNPCSHGCKYCFNILNGMNKHCDMVSLTNLIVDFKNRDTFVARLLNEGYPVLMSNRSDPFANSNYEQAVSVIKLMHEVGIPMAFQTKGGKGIDETLEILNGTPTCWYITITHSDDETRKIFEPGAPDIDSRFKLCEKLRSKGNRVQVGMNPMVREWIGYGEKVKSFVKRLKDSGVESVYIQNIHFNRKQIKNMSAKTKHDFGDIINEGLKRIVSDDYYSYFKTVKHELLSNGIIVGSDDDWDSDYWKCFDETYPVLFPNTTDFIQHCHKTLEDNTFIAYSYFKRMIVDKFPKGKYRIDNYIKNKGYRMAKIYDLNKKMSFDKILKIMWFDTRCGKMLLGDKKEFSQLVEKGSDGKYFRPISEDGMPYYCFRRAGFKSHVVDIDGKEVFE